MARSWRQKRSIGGYAIFELRDKQEALASATEFMQLHLDHMPGWEGTCEVRAFGMPDGQGGCAADVAGALAEFDASVV